MLWFVLVRNRSEYTVVGCMPGADPLYGYGSWDLANPVGTDAFDDLVSIFDSVKWLMKGL